MFDRYQYYGTRKGQSLVTHCIRTSDRNFVYRISLRLLIADTTESVEYYLRHMCQDAGPEFSDITWDGKLHFALTFFPR